MMRLVSNLDWNRFTSRTWIISSGDQLSESKALDLEKEIGSGHVSSLLLRVISEDFADSNWGGVIVSNLEDT